jgi:hypothetical protein
MLDHLPLQDNEGFWGVGLGFWRKLHVMQDFIITPRLLWQFPLKDVLTGDVAILVQVLGRIGISHRARAWLVSMAVRVAVDDTSWYPFIEYACGRVVLDNTFLSLVLHQGLREVARKTLSRGPNLAAANICLKHAEFALRSPYLARGHLCGLFLIIRDCATACPGRACGLLTNMLHLDMVQEMIVLSSYIICVLERFGDETFHLQVRSLIENGRFLRTAAEALFPLESRGDELYRLRCRKRAPTRCWPVSRDLHDRGIPVDAYMGERRIRTSVAFGVPFAALIIDICNKFSGGYTALGEVDSELLLAMCGKDPDFTLDENREMREILATEAAIFPHLPDWHILTRRTRRLVAYDLIADFFHNEPPPPNFVLDVEVDLDLHTLQIYSDQPRLPSSKRIPLFSAGHWSLIHAHQDDAVMRRFVTAEVLDRVGSDIMDARDPHGDVGTFVRENLKLFPREMRLFVGAVQGTCPSLVSWLIIGFTGCGPLKRPLWDPPVNVYVNINVLDVWSVICKFPKELGIRNYSYRSSTDDFIHLFSESVIGGLTNGRGLTFPRELDPRYLQPFGWMCGYLVAARVVFPHYGPALMMRRRFITDLTGPQLALFALGFDLILNWGQLMQYVSATEVEELLRRDVLPRGK